MTLVNKTFNALHQNDLIKTDVGAGIVTIADYDYLYDLGLDKRMLVSKILYTAEQILELNLLMMR